MGKLYVNTIRNHRFRRKFSMPEIPRWIGIAGEIIGSILTLALIFLSGVVFLAM